MAKWFLTDSQIQFWKKNWAKILGMYFILLAPIVGTAYISPCGGLYLIWDNGPKIENTCPRGQQKLDPLPIHFDSIPVDEIPREPNTKPQDLMIIRQA